MKQTSFLQGCSTPSQEMHSYLEAIRHRPARAARWIPTRIILQNYWLFDYQEFYLADGRLVLRGPNSSGKSTVLAVGIPVALDGDKGRERFDPFGSRDRNPAYYLLGRPEDGPSSDFYHEDRTGYVAWEFQHSADRRFITIGIGLRARRVGGGGDPRVDSWGFVILDGRRVGIDFHLHTGEPDRIPLSRRQLKERLEPGNYVTEKNRPSEYQERVNQALFGFDSIEQLRFLTGILVSLRSPKLNKDIRPEDVCEILTDSLPPLDEELLAQVANILENIDKYLEDIRITGDQLERVKALDEALATHLNQQAQRKAVEHRKRESALSDVRGARVRAQESMSEQTLQLEEIQTCLSTLEEERRKADARRRVLEQSDAYKDQERLADIEEQLKQARERHSSSADELKRAVSAIERGHGRVVQSGVRWKEKLDELRSDAVELLKAGETAAWAFAQEKARGLVSALRDISLDDSLDHSPVSFSGTLVELGEQRRENLSRIETALKAKDKATQELHTANVQLESMRREMNRAGDALQEADSALEQARTIAISSLEEWVTASTAPQLTDMTVALVCNWLAVYEDPAQNVGELLAPIECEVAAITRAVEDERQQRREEIAELNRRISTVDGEVRDWEQRRWATPAPRRGQLEARSRLEAAGVPFAALYAACDVALDIPTEMAVRLEANLEEAGLLDALILPESHRDEALGLLSSLLGREAGERWLLTGPPVLGSTLADYLIPAECAVSEHDVLGALRAIAVDHNEAATSLSSLGGWRLGLLSGAAAQRNEMLPVYIGEANRLRQRRETLARLQTQKDELTRERDQIQKVMNSLTTRLNELDGALGTLRNLSSFSKLSHRAVLRRRAEDELERRRKEVEKEDRKLISLRENLQKSNTAYIEATGLDEAAPGRNLEGLHALRECTREVVRMAPGLGRTWRDLVAIRDEHLKLQHEKELEEARVIRLRPSLQEYHLQVMGLEQKSETIRMELERLGLQEIRDELRAIDELLEQWRRDELRLTKEQGGLQKSLHLLGENVAKHQDEEVRFEAASRTSAEELEASLSTYPTLAAVLELFRSGPAGPLQAAEELLKLRRVKAEELERQIEDSAKLALNRLAREFADNHAQLIEFQPELTDESLIYFRHQGQKLLPYLLAGELERFRHRQQRAVVEEEANLYEDFFIKDVARAIRDKIALARHSNTVVNDLLAKNRLSNQEILSLGWDPIAAEGEAADYRTLIKLLERDLTVLPDEQHRWITEFFQRRVGEVREAERRGTNDQSFALALKKVLDYRTWFRFTLYSKMPSSPRVELNSKRFNQRSGAEKSLAMFIPLLAAVHARYDGAREDAPKLIGIDEAFAGVDDRNTHEMFRFLVQLDFCWIMTSEKLWGDSETLPACTTYHLNKVGSIVAPELFIWDGVRRRSQRTIGAGIASATASSPWSDSDGPRR